MPLAFPTNYLYRGVIYRKGELIPKELESLARKRGWLKPEQVISLGASDELFEDGADDPSGAGAGPEALPKRIVNALMKAGFTAEQTPDLSDETLLGIQGIGEAGLKLVRLIHGPRRTG